MAETEVKADNTQTQEKSEMRVEMRMPADKHQRLRKMARYAAVERIIPDDHRGNITDWINYCLKLGEDQLTLYAHKKRGF